MFRWRMARPLTRAQALQNRAFLKALGRSGNVRLACREAGLKYSTMQHRRSRHPGFAVRWDAELAGAQARFARIGLRVARGRALTQPSPTGRGPYRTLGGELVIVRRNDGKLQMRRAQPGSACRCGRPIS